MLSTNFYTKPKIDGILFWRETAVNNHFIQMKRIMAKIYQNAVRENCEVNVIRLRVQWVLVQDQEGVLIRKWAFGGQMAV